MSLLPCKVTADLPEHRHISVVRPESRHVSADLPESRHVSAIVPQPRHVTAVVPEPRHVVAICHVLSAAPRSLRSVLHCPSLVSSVRDAPLVSARAAGIPKPTHFTPPVCELIPPSAARSIMGTALWCVWAAYTTTAVSPEVAAYAA
ncbi:Transcription initiation factor TFIID subunit 2 [Labeo rohita]|uniref:Transcription initiation factor TFIID subunit 2 n=1 Tax=Labeo rohita TaxID=84645 RepID=A0ABQ8MUU3_LABRO|nr:Transcription initiation factor TFIID subunit 2 [Labeo rohita]